MAHEVECSRQFALVCAAGLWSSVISTTVVYHICSSENGALGGVERLMITGECTGQKLKISVGRICLSLMLFSISLCEMFDCLFPPLQAIIDGIAEKGAQFTEQEYVQLVQLQHRSQPGSASAQAQEQLEVRLGKLRNVIQKVGQHNTSF